MATSPESQGLSLHSEYHPSLTSLPLSFFVGYSSTYLVNMLQLVNNLADHRFRALHFQLMEVELIFHSIPRCLLAVSAKVKVKRKFVTRESEAKLKLTCIWHQWSNWTQAQFRLLKHEMTPWNKNKPLQIESLYREEHSFDSQQKFIQHPYFFLSVGSTITKTDKAFIKLSL